MSKGATYDGRNTVGLEQLYSIDKDGKLLSKYLKHDVIDMYGPLAESNFAGDGENIFYKNIFDENIYVITPDTAQVLYNFDFGPYKIDEKILKLDKDKILQEIGTISFININTLLVNQNYVYVYFQKEKSGIIESYHFMYEIKSGNSLIIRQDGKSAESSYIIPKLLTANNELLFLMDAEYMNEPDKQQLCSGALVSNNCKSTIYVIKINISDLFSAK